MDEFQYVRSARLNEFNFREKSENKISDEFESSKMFGDQSLVSQIPTPDETPTPARNMFPNLEMSDTLEAVLSQNEDALARLKVTLRRLAEMETALLFSKREKTQLEKAFQGLTQDKRVWDEKENQWLQRLAELEIKSNRVSEVEDENYRLKDRLDRFRRYQEKIRTQVKPYVQNLKSFAEAMATQVQDLNLEISQLESKLDKTEIERNASQQKLQTETQHHARMLENLSINFEQQTKLLQLENTELKKQQTRLELQVTEYDVTRTRETELENLIIAMRKDLENQKTYQSDVNRQAQAEISRLKIQASEHLANSEVIKAEKSSLETELMSLRQRSERNEEQLAALRILWTDKTKSLEKLQLANQSLESINQDLAQQLSRFRNNVI